MGRIENQWRDCVSRRSALRALAGVLAGSPLLRGQQDPFRDHSRVPGLNELLTAFDFESVAHARLPREPYDFTMAGGDDEFTLRRNRQAFDWVGLVPRGIADVSSINPATELFGKKLAYPILVAPSSGQLALHPLGEIGMHHGATAASNTIMIVSNSSSQPFDKIAAAAPGPVWFQLYPSPTPEENVEKVDRAQAAGCQAIAVTVDGPYEAYRERPLHDRRLGGRGESDATAAIQRARARRGSSVRSNYGLGARSSMDWRLFEAVRPRTKVPLLIKGILTPEDARLSIEHGLDGIIVSNHGARRVDHGPSTLEVLPEIVDEVKGRVPVLIDSGFRRGSDILKALALGAKAVCLGRVPRWGLAAYGDTGAQRVLEIVQSELVMAMAYTGRPDMGSIDRTLVRTDFPWK